MIFRKKYSAGSAIILFLCCFLLHGRAGRGESIPEKFIKVFFPNKKSVTAELAVSDEERARGLMFREKVFSDQGMLFIFEEDGIHSFWMKNTLVYLDILWLDSAKRVIHIEANAPPCPEEPCPSYGPRIPARYVLELRGGSAEENGIRVSDRVQFILPENIRQYP